MDDDVYAALPNPLTETLLVVPFVFTLIVPLVEPVLTDRTPLLLILPLALIIIPAAAEYVLEGTFTNIEPSELISTA